MRLLKAIGIVFACAGAAAAMGGLYWWGRQRYGSSAEPKEVSKSDEHAPRGIIIDEAELLEELGKELDRLFPEGWPPSQTTVEGLTPKDVVLFGAQSDVVGGYDQPRQELLQARVLSVEPGVVRGRVAGEVDHAEHHGSHAGHGFRVGDSVQVPRDQVLAVVRPPTAEGYNSEGKSQDHFKPSDQTKERYDVHPGTPYDFVLPHWNERLTWHLDSDHVSVRHIGIRGLHQQIAFSEDSMRGPLSVRVLDEDPDLGTIHVGRWDLNIIE